MKQPNPKSISVNQSNMSLDHNDSSFGSDGQPCTNITNKYNISNFFKHIYSLKSINVSVQPVQSSPSLSLSSTSLTNSDNQLKTSSSKQFWMPDEQVKECFQCSQKFTTIRRRHVIFALSFCFCLNKII